MSSNRKRRAPAQDDDDDEDEEPQPATQRRRTLPAENEDDDDFGEGNNAATQSIGDSEHMAKNLVRLALASEYSRTPLRRAELSAKILGTNPRAFRQVFAIAQDKLRITFGMELVELPMREKVTMAQKKAAAKAQSQQKSSGAWVLRSILPARFRDADILSISHGPTAESEAQYAALYTFIISMIVLSGGTLADGRLQRNLARVNINDMNPLSHSMAINGIDKTERLLKRMEKDGYVVKIRDNTGGDEVIDWMVGPRGKVEVGENGVRGMVEGVFGETDDPEELQQRLKRSLAAFDMAAQTADAAADKRAGKQSDRANGAAAGQAADQSDDD